ncbi:uncharacterized protein A1O5_06462 [Cladophialophora psammophila CBS 110553]|uniref:Uncharacterized protein n=1 Tax=Cladophialophora psammophila CBS 110553 TaxID=1182543 RepID=W9XJ64_9EURO|nr:uncharacterized protein A1O5_06462 [Cladophialophora psammophila CBS 110553]EXJ70394.1 hypothetical protein A1O5_06462 [Cladophialophora psammophila CBS 110553]
MADQDSIVAALRQYTTCDVSDALMKLKHPHGGFLPGLTMWSPERQGEAKLAGPAYTVKYVRKNYENEPKPASHYIDTIPKGAVVFVSSPPGIVNAVYGGLMSTRAQASGAAGTVVDGRIRDVQEHRKLGYPVFARDVGTTAPYEVVRVSEINVPLRLYDDTIDAVVEPGDYIVGDINGVVCLPKAMAKKVLELIPAQLEADQRVAEDLKNGVTFAEASTKHRGVKR